MTNVLSYLWPRTEGRPALCIGGGPSVKDYGLWSDKVQDAMVIGTNSAYKLNPDLLVVYDAQFLRWAQIQPDWNDYKGPVVSFSRNAYSVDEHHQYILMPESREWGEADTLLRASNVGLTALNLAWQLGCYPINLIGYDMMGRAWTDEHPEPETDKGTFDGMQAAFEKYWDCLDGVPVHNLNPHSRMA